jgi:hypothetical protein
MGCQNLNIDLREIGCNDMIWIELDQGRLGPVAGPNIGCDECLGCDSQGIS